jgi:hypothetical protein
VRNGDLTFFLLGSMPTCPMVAGPLTNCAVDGVARTPYHSSPRRLIEALKGRSFARRGPYKLGFVSSVYRGFTGGGPASLHKWVQPLCPREPLPGSANGGSL